MARTGRPTGSKTKTNTRPWSDAIRRAVARSGKSGLNSLADKLLEKVLEDDMQAIKEFGDRYEGKIPQAIEGPGDNGEHLLTTTVEVTIVDPKA